MVEVYKEKFWEYWDQIYILDSRQENSPYIYIELIETMIDFKL